MENLFGTTGIQRSFTRLSAVAEEFRELDLMFNSGSDLDVVEKGYARKLIHAISSEDVVLECEALKSLGDVYLKKAKINDDKAENLKKACGLYTEVLRYCRTADDKQVIEHRIKYAEKCTKLKHCQSHMKSDIEASDNITLAVAMELHKLKDKTKLRGYGVMPLVEAYTKYFVAAVVYKSKRQEIESLKSLGDIYIDKGKLGKDDAAFTKAVGLYRAALGRCEDSDGRETLEHRIKYAENAKRKEVKKRQNAGEPRNLTITDILKSSPAESLSTIDQRNGDGAGYKDQLQEGCRALQTGDLDAAEHHFAAALKAVHLKAKDEYKEEVEPLCKLSDVYLERGKQSKDGSDFTKAAALCNAALIRAKIEDRKGIKQTILRVNQSFIEHVLTIEKVVDMGATEKHKSILKKDREFVEKEIKRIEQEADPYVLEDDDPTARDVEKKRAEAIKVLFQAIVQQRKTLIAGLVDECIAVMGPTPCKYAMIGLGSHATGLVTPYSDLEFAILVEDESEQLQNVKYFRNLTHYLHLKVINLGETIIPAMAIKCLNDFYSDDPLENWYYDSITPRGFAFDGAMPHACKTPLGRGTSELIHTPIGMISVLKDDLTLYLKKGYHLATVLGNVSLITGEQALVNEYTSLWSQHLQENNGLLSSLEATTTLSENTQMFEKKGLTSNLVDVKKEMYRFSSLVVSCWALLHNIHPTTIWETIEELEKGGAVDSENAHHLMVMVSISAELRLRTYMNNGGQVENLSALSSMSTNTDFGAKLKKVFYFSNRKQLMRYYYTARPLKHFISQLSDKKPNEQSIFFDNSSELKAEIYLSLCDYESSKMCIEQTLQKNILQYGDHSVHFDSATSCTTLGNDWIHDDDGRAVSSNEQPPQMKRLNYDDSTVHPEIADSLTNLGNVCSNLGDHRKAIGYLEQSLQMKRRIYGENTAQPTIAFSLGNMGSAWSNLGDNKKAISYYEKALQMKRSIYGEGTIHPDIALSLNNLGKAWSSLGDYRKAISYKEQSLKMKRSIYGEDTAHPDIASTLNNLGTAWRDLGNHRKAIGYYEQSLKMNRRIYGEDSAHPVIASSLSNFGTAWNDLGDYRKAIGYYEQALQMKSRIYGEDTAHPDIADSLNNLANAWNNLGNHTKAISYYEQTLQMKRGIYGEGTAHPGIASTLNNLGNAWSNLGDHRKAINYYEQSLQMNHRVFGGGTAHPEIAFLHNNLGAAWICLGDHRKAIGYYELSLQMKKKIYGENTAHPDIASLLNNLGSAWSDLGDHRKAISYHEQSLQMKWSIFGKDTAHPGIAFLLSNMGKAWSDLGDHRKAISYYEQSLQMKKSIYGKDNVHSSIASSLNNLGNAWSDLGDHRKAIKYYEQSLQMRRSIYRHGEDTAHPHIADSLNNLAVAWSDLGDHKMAINYYEQSLQIKRHIYGKNTAHPDIAATLNNMAVAYRDLGDHRRAISYYEQSLQMMRSIHAYGEATGHPNITN
uniref:Uncharacterized protein n=1 Tax=Branchiostoma floridae TaxID=7739 RepID=C3Y3H0_BRAFL|eukprot:XP_002609227.1 hypothetical protein BRAFLDRAFT_90681 [Branchiostoma floridae]